MDLLKIDRSFLQDVDVVSTCALIQAITAVAHSLGLRVAAEGIETQLQRIRFAVSVSIWRKATYWTSHANGSGDRLPAYRVLYLTLTGDPSRSSSVARRTIASPSFSAGLKTSTRSPAVLPLRRPPIRHGRCWRG